MTATINPGRPCSVNKSGFAHVCLEKAPLAFRGPRARRASRTRRCAVPFYAVEFVESASRVLLIGHWEPPATKWVSRRVVLLRSDFNFQVFGKGMKIRESGRSEFARTLGRVALARESPRPRASLTSAITLNLLECCTGPFDMVRIGFRISL